MTSPKISSALRKEHIGETVISLDGKVLAFGKNAIIAFNKAQKIVPDLDEKEFSISRIQPKYIAA